jgi:hypothetical protein
VFVTAVFLIALIAFLLIGIAWLAEVLWRTGSLGEVFGFVAYWSLAVWILRNLWLLMTA